MFKILKQVRKRIKKLFQISNGGSVKSDSPEMATKILPSGNGSHVNSKARRSEKRGRRERCRTQHYEGGPVEDTAASPDQRGFRPRHKSCDPKVDLKSKRRSLPSGPEEFVGSESDSPEEETRRWARRPRRLRADGHRTNESGNSSGNQNRNSYNSQKNLKVPDPRLTAQPSSDSAIYMLQRGQNNNSSNGSKGKFQKLEERRRQRLEMTVTSDEEGVNLSDGYQKPKPQKTLTNGKSDNILEHQPQIAFAQSFSPSSYNDQQQTAFFNFAGPVSPKLEMDSEDLKTKRPVSMLKAQFEKQMQTPITVPSVSRVSSSNFQNSSGPSWRPSNSSALSRRRLSAESITTPPSVTLRQPVNWQVPKANDPPSVSIKPVKAPSASSSSVPSLTKSMTKSYQPLNNRPSKLSKDHNFNDADSLDELLESNRDYLGLSNDEDKVAIKANIKQTMKTMQQSSSGKPNTELGAVFSKRRISDPMIQVKNLAEVSQSVQQVVTKPSWPRNILSSLSPTIANKAIVNTGPTNNGASNLSITIPAQQSLSLTSPCSENLDDLWIPRKVDKENSVKFHQRQKPVIVPVPVMPISPNKKERTFTYNTPMMVISDLSTSMPAKTTVNVLSPDIHQAQTVDGLALPPGPDGMFSDVDYNIEVSERVKKWEFLMHEKKMPNRKNETPDKINLVEGDENGQVLSPRSNVFTAARLSVIDEKSEAKSMFGYPGMTIDGSNVFTNSGGDLMLSQDQLWTYPGNMQNSPLPKNKTAPQGSVRHPRQDTIIGDEVWHSDWFFKGYMNQANQSPKKVEKEVKQPVQLSPVEQKRYSSSYGSSPKMTVRENKPAQVSPVVQKRYSSSYGSSPKMTRKIVYEPMKSDSSPTRLNPFYGPSSDSEITNPLYTPIKTGVLSVSPTKKTATRPSDVSINGSHRRQDSDEQIWKEIERMTMYARAIAGAASSTAKIQQSSLPKSNTPKNLARRSAYEPLAPQKSNTDPFVPLSVDVGSPKKTKPERFSNPFDNVPLVASVKVYQPQRSSKSLTTTKSIQYQHVPITDKYQRPEALDEVLEEITTSLEKKPFSPKNKSPGLSSSSQWSTGTPEKPPLSPDIISMTTSQHLKLGNEPTGGRPSSMSFPHAQPTFYAQVRDLERRQQEKNPKFMNLAHGKEYLLDHDLLKQKLLGTGLVERHIEEDRFADSGSNKAADSDSGSQHSMTHINKAIRELSHLASDVESRIDMIKTRLVTTKEEDLDTVLSTLRRCSSNLASAKSGQSGSTKNRKTKLNDALSELERIYECLELKSDDMESRGKRDYSTSQGSQWSITSMTDISSLGSYPHSSSEVHTDTNVSDYKWQSPRLNRPPKRQNFYSTDGLEQLTQALESSVFVENNNNSWRPQDGEETPRATNLSNFSYCGISQQRFSSGVDTYTPTESLSALSSEESNRRPRSRRKEVDLTDERSYRKIRTKSATRMDTDSPHMSPLATDYSSQRTRPEARSRVRTRIDRDTEDFAYRNLRRDVIIEHPKPPPRSSSLHRKGKGRSDEGSDSESHLCNAETQTCHVDDGDSSGLDASDIKDNERQGRSKERSYASRKIAKEEQKRRRSLGRGVAKMIERFSSSEDERQPKRRLKHSRSAPDLSEQAFYSDTYNSKGEIMSTETDTNKEDDNKKSEENQKQKKNKSTSAKSQTPRTVKQRNEAKSKIRSNQTKNENMNGTSSKMVNQSTSAQNKSILKMKNVDKIISSSDQTPLGSSCEGSPASARLLIHRRTKRVPLATISTTSTSGDESAGSRSSLNQSMVLPQGGVIRRQIPADLPRGNSVKLRQKKSDVSKEEREERSKSVPELCAKFETDPSRLKTILGTLRKSISAGGVPIESFQKKSFCSEPNLRDNHHKNRIINKETLLLNWNLNEDTEKEIFC